MCGATRKKASSNRDAGKSEEYTRTRAVRERNPPSGKQDDEKKARGIQRKEGRVPCFVWASQRGWSSFIERMDSGNIVRVFVCVMRARVSVCKNTEEEEDNNNKKKREKRISSHSLAKAKYRCLSIFYFILYSYNCARWIICDSMHPLNLIPTAFGLFHATWNTFTVLFNLVNVFGRSGEKRRLLVKDRRNDV